MPCGGGVGGGYREDIGGEVIPVNNNVKKSPFLGLWGDPGLHMCCGVHV